MPTDVANQIVNHIFGDEKAKAVDAVNDALARLHMMRFKQRNLTSHKSGVLILIKQDKLLLMNLLIKQLIQAMSLMWIIKVANQKIQILMSQ
ncbi:MAG: hypothetical protein CM15mV11_1030 [Caudoviricetes sp.]|nr:MAG: hypothetical protein CM15mV11_1030 [Caudoviricetes sp.]